MCQFCDMLGLKYSYYVNSNRYHGFNIPVNKLDNYLVIAADFEILQEEVENLVKHNVVILSTDHHDCQREFIDVKGDKAEGIVINNQYPFEPEEDRYLSGAGVFYELIISLYPEFQSKEREALVGVTLLSDIREIENKKAEKYLRTTYSIDSTQGYVKYLIDSVLDTDYNFGVPKLDRNFIDYTFSPTINSLLRFDRTQEAIDFILGKGLKTTAYRGKQKDLVEQMSVKATVLELPSIDILALNELDFDEDIQPSRFIGLLCSNWKDRHKNKSCLAFTYENGKSTRASFRGKYDDIHYKTGFIHLGLDAHGHPGAFGIIDLQFSENLWVELNDMIADLESSHVEYNTIINCNNLAIKMIQDGLRLATNNCYVRDMYRTYIKYTGTNVTVNKITYKMRECCKDEEADVVSKTKRYVYLRDEKGELIPKYIEYLVDGRKVKSFGVSIADGLILPILDKGYIQLYLRSKIN